ncbi:MAG: hypothetical protein KTR29_23470 [Rhodothermaceae bacterium]|nr:hypothetical protein [Rhodothermaceae bacterium]
MKTQLTSIISMLLLLFVAACQPQEETVVDEGLVRSADAGPAKVELIQNNGQYQIMVDGQPFYIKGAGLEFGSVEQLADHGANSFRTWRTDNGQDTGMEVLDSALENGLMVTMGIEIAREREGSGRGVFGFDYDDDAAVAEQLERVREEVMLYKDHPALMIWSIGNELNLGATNPKVWDAVNEISEMIHEIDPNHLTTTTLAGINKELADDIKERASDLDLLSIQMYADIVNLPRYLDEVGWEGPYMITEWGATGHWEVGTTSWEAPIENHSSAKADFYKERYEVAIGSQKAQCVGSYVFLWGQKQERTPTWYGMFMPTGEETESVDVMHYIWNGTWPDNRSPRLESAVLDGKTAYDNIYLDAGQSYAASVSSTDPDGDALHYVWEIRRESTDLSHGGDDESVPDEIEGRINDSAVDSIEMTAPDEPGAYRLFVYVYDGEGHAAHANIPFYVNS